MLKLHTYKVTELELEMARLCGLGPPWTRRAVFSRCLLAHAASLLAALAKHDEVKTLLGMAELSWLMDRFAAETNLPLDGAVAAVGASAISRLQGTYVPVDLAKVFAKEGAKACV